MFANNRDGTFSEVSGVVGLDFPEDSRSFVLADLDHDGRLEVILKNRNAPQLRILHNSNEGCLARSVAFRLRGQTEQSLTPFGTCHHRSRSAPSVRRNICSAGSGFLAQHSKEAFLWSSESPEGVRPGHVIRWPSGLNAGTLSGYPGGPPHRNRRRARLNLRPNPSPQQPSAWTQPVARRRSGGTAALAGRHLAASNH